MASSPANRSIDRCPHCPCIARICLKCADSSLPAGRNVTLCACLECYRPPWLATAILVEYVRDGGMINGRTCCADGASFSIECFVSFEPLRSTSEDESLTHLWGWTTVHCTRHRTQRGIEIAARCTWSSAASPFYGPFDISARRAAAVGRAQNYYSCTSCANRSVGMLLLLLGLGRSKQGAAPQGRFPIFHAHPFIACYSSNFGPLHNVGEGTRIR